MERVDLELSEFTRRARSVLIAHSATSLERGLEPGEQLLVRDSARHLLATVRDVSFDLTDTHYRVELGAMVAEAEVDLLLAETCPTAASAFGLGDVLSLLQDARSAAAGRSYLAGGQRR